MTEVPPVSGKRALIKEVSLCCLLLTFPSLSCEGRGLSLGIKCLLRYGRFASLHSYEKQISYKLFNIRYTVISIRNKYRHDLTFTSAGCNLTGTWSDIYFRLDLKGPLIQQVEL